MNDDPLRYSTPESEAQPAADDQPAAEPAVPGEYGEPYDRRQARQERREQRRAERRARGSGAPWLGGAILVALGLFFLAQNLGIQVFANWWALFILIPAIGSLGAAWNIYRANGSQWTPAARGPLVAGLILLLVTAAFLLGLNWGLVLPVLLILAGVAVLLTGLGR